MRAAFYECDVTPPLGGYMSGYYSRRFADSVEERLYSRAVVIEDDGNLCAFVSIDTCLIPEDMHEIVTKRIFDYTGIEPKNVCICSDHTHRGAPVEDGPEIGAYKDSAYTDVFYRLTADAVILAYRKLKDAELSFGLEEVQGIAYNRDFIPVEGTDEVTTLAGTDTTLSVIRVDIDGKPSGAIVSFALHQDTAEPVSGYTGDYASIMSEELKKKYGNDFVTVFLLGTCGDINHFSYEDVKNKNWGYKNHRRIGKAIADKVVSAMDKTTPIADGIKTSKEMINVKKRIANVEQTIKAIQNQIDKKMPFFDIRNIVYYHATNQSEDYPLYIQIVKLGDVCIYCLPGEIYVNWGFMIKEKSPFSKNIVIENCNTHLGYVPTPEVFDYDDILYETQLCYGSCLVPEAGQVIVDKALDMAKKLE